MKYKISQLYTLEGRRVAREIFFENFGLAQGTYDYLSTLEKTNRIILWRKRRFWWGWKKVKEQ